MADVVLVGDDNFNLVDERRAAARQEEGERKS
jgi:hypothetical protein